MKKPTSSVAPPSCTRTPRNGTTDGCGGSCMREMLGGRPQKSLPKLRPLAALVQWHARNSVLNGALKRKTTRSLRYEPLPSMGTAVRPPAYEIARIELQPVHP